LFLEFELLYLLNVPITLIKGCNTKSSVWQSEATLTDLLNILPKCKPVFMKETSHFGIMEKPTEIAELIKEALNPPVSKL